MWQNIRRLFPADVCLAVTPQVTLVAAQTGKIFPVPTKLLVKKKNYEVVAFGDDAREVEHAGLSETKVVVPFSATEILDEAGAVAFLRTLFRLALGSGFLLKPRLWLALPSETSPFMQELWQSAVLQAGARELVTVHPLLAGAVGAELPIDSSHGYAVAMIHDQSCSIGLLSFGHLQKEYRQTVTELGKDEAISEVIAQSWNAFLKLVPSEFVPTLAHEGLVLLYDSDNPALPSELTKSCQVPVVLAPTSAVIIGLQELRKRGEGQEV